MKTINDFQLIKELIHEIPTESPSAEDEFFTRLEEQHELNSTLSDINLTTVTRTTVHHYRHATVVKVERLITSTRRNSEIHIYH